jgi:hypothetical protein
MGPPVERTTTSFITVGASLTAIMMLEGSDVDVFFLRRLPAASSRKTSKSTVFTAQDHWNKSW